MRKLLYVPILHSRADLGSVAKAVEERGVGIFGEEAWDRHMDAIAGFWSSIENYFKDLPVDFGRVKIYQDSLVAGGERGMDVVEEAAARGSKNYHIISELVKQGATIVKTEDISIVKQEVEQIKNLAQSESILTKLAAFLKYKFTKGALLRYRDEFIAGRIDETLKDGETGILFIGAFHDVIPKLPADLEVEEVKSKQKVERYQKIYLLKGKDPEVEALAGYLKAPVSEPKVRAKGAGV